MAKRKFNLGQLRTCRERSMLMSMLKLFKDIDAFTFRGDRIERGKQALEVALEQIRLGLEQVDDYRLEAALVDAQDLIATALVRLAESVEAGQGADGGADDGQAWLPLLAA